MGATSVFQMMDNRRMRLPSRPSRLGLTLLLALDGLRVTVDEPTRRAIATVTANVQAAPELGGELLASREL